MVQLYVAGRPGEAVRSLRGFRRLFLRAGERREVTFTIAAADLPSFPAEVSIGGGQPLRDTPHVRGSLPPEP